MSLFLLIFLQLLHNALGFKTGMESGQICYQCVGTHPGCGMYDFDGRYYWGKQCPRSDDRCVKVIERKGSNIMVTRDCLSSLEGYRVDIPADKYEGCRAGSKDVKLGQYTFNRIKELDVKRDYYDNITWCFCAFDHWCNTAAGPRSSAKNIVFLLMTILMLASVLLHV